MHETPEIRGPQVISRAALSAGVIVKRKNESTSYGRHLWCKHACLGLCCLCDRIGFIQLSAGVDLAMYIQGVVEIRFTNRLV